MVYLRLHPRIVEAIRAAARARGWTLNRWCETALEEALRGGTHRDELRSESESEIDFLPPTEEGRRHPRAR